MILDRGHQRFWGTLEELRRTFLAEEHDASLERIFFLATEFSESQSAATAEHTDVGPRG